MRKQALNRLIAFTMVAMLASPMITEAAEDIWNVKISDVDYYMELNDSSDIFLCNKESIGADVGTEYYLTYTVDEMKAETFRQQGVIGTSVPTQAYPYVASDAGGGIYKYSNVNKMLIEGYTYFLKFVITEDGYTYKVAWAEHKEDKSKYIEYDLEYGEVKTNLGYFGVYFGDLGLCGKLTKIRCYDKNGNDLGIQVTPGCGATTGREKAIPKDTEVEHTYTIVLKDTMTIALSNKKVATSDKVYMEYKVESADSHIYQTGVILSNAPKAGYPFESGLLLYEKYDYNPETAGNGALLEVGAEYLIIYEKKAEMLDVTVQKTKDGKAEIFTFPIQLGTYYKDAEYFSLWFGEGASFPVNCVLTNFKCYDSNKNNLSVQCNRNCEIIHYGELEDYSGCEALYCNEEDDSIYALYEDKTLKYTENGVTSKGNYRIESSVISITLNDKTEEYDFLYSGFENAKGTKYKRLRTYKAIFETGDGSKIETQILSPESGYIVMRPTDPTCEGNQFAGWYTKDGEAFDFEQLVTNSITLYAKWEKDVYADGNISGLNVTPYVAVGLAVLILVASIGGAVVVQKGKKDGSKK